MAGFRVREPVQRNEGQARTQMPTLVDVDGDVLLKLDERDRCIYRKSTFTMSV